MPMVAQSQNYQSLGPRDARGLLLVVGVESQITEDAQATAAGGSCPSAVAVTNTARDPGAPSLLAL